MNNTNNKSEQNCQGCKAITVVHERDKCIGCNSCVTIAPQNWVMFEGDGKARLIGSKQKGMGAQKVYVGEIFEEDLEANLKAAAACPVSIIKIANN